MYKYIISFVHAHAASLLCGSLILLHCLFQIGGINPGIKIYLIGDDTIVKFKLDGTAAEALAQIETCGYARPYAADKRHLHKVGASFSSQTGTIEEWLVED